MNIFVDIRFWLLFIGLFGAALLIQHISFIMTAKKDAKNDTKSTEGSVN